MLRITTIRDDASGVVMKLEGKLVGRWVALLREVWEQHRRTGRPLALNLSAVAFASKEGRDLLCRLQSDGVVCSDWPPLLRALCEEHGGGPETPEQT